MTGRLARKRTTDTFLFRYLHLITEEHAAIKAERAVLDQFEQLENAEREAFHTLSNKVGIDTLVLHTHTLLGYLAKGQS